MTKRKVTVAFLLVSLSTWAWVEAQIDSHPPTRYIIEGQFLDINGNGMKYHPYTVTPGTNPGNEVGK